MIEFPPPEPPPVNDGRRGLLGLAVAAALVLVLAVALVNVHRNHKNSATTAPNGSARNSTGSQPSAAPSSGTGSNGGSGGGVDLIPTVACPQIRDEQSHLGYQCIDNYLQQDDPDNYLGLRISLDHEVEPGWVISEGSGNPQSLASPPPTTVVGYRSAATKPTQPTRSAGPVFLSPAGPVAAPALPTPDEVSAEVRRRTELALAQAYGDNPSSKNLAGHVRAFGAVQGYELVTEITMNPAFRAQRHLNARTERLWTVGIPTKAGVSIFMLSIPDARADLWPKAEATVGTVHVL